MLIIDIFLYICTMNTKTGNILIVDDNNSIRQTLELLLPAHFEKVLAIATPNLIIETLRNNPDLDAVLLDMNFNSGINSGNEGIYWLNEIKRMRPNISVILFTAYADIPLAVRAIQHGAIDFIEKPWNNEKLIITLRNGVEFSRNASKIKALKSIDKSESKMFWGNSQQMINLRKLVNKVAPTDANILILGENGTGKEVLAREIHSLSQRCEERMVSVDMGSVTESLFESELFGHAKGAFTDAKSERAGKFEIANGSSLFLDEIGNLPLHLQSKLLTALQSRSVVRVGENAPRAVDVRLICATNANLEQMVRSGEFREDLLYRINTIVLSIPPLRERQEDILVLAEQFLVEYSTKYQKKCTSFSDSAKDKLLEHKWLGNIRELQHTIERSVIICDTSEVIAEDLLINKPSNSTNNTIAFGDLSLDEMEKKSIVAAINSSNGNLSEVATKLGITRQTLYNKLKKHKISI